MTDVKTPQLSPAQWQELLEPYGWVDLTISAPAVRFQTPAELWEYEFRVMLKPPADSDAPEWVRRADLLDQARGAVKAVRAQGYWLPQAPRIEFAGRYMYRAGQEDPSWIAEAELRFTALPARRSSP
jgi:hypothetical protein